MQNSLLHTLFYFAFKFKRLSKAAFLGQIGLTILVIIYKCFSKLSLI